MHPGILGVQLDIGRLEGELASVRHGVSRVDGQVHHDLLDLPQIGLGPTEDGVEHCDEIDILPDQSPEHLGQIGDHRIQIQHSRLEHLLPAEGEQLVRQVGGPLGRPRNLLDGRAYRMFRVETSEHDVRPPHDDHEQVVEVVGHPAREMSHRFHLARLGQLILGLGQLVVGALDLLVEAAVLEGHRGLRGEGGGNHDILGREPLVAPREYAEHPHHPFSDLDRDDQQRLIAATVKARSMGRGDARIIGEVRDHQRLAPHRHSAGQAFAHAQALRDHDVPRVTPRSGEDQLVPVHSPKADGVRVEEPPACFGNGGEE